MAAATWMYGKSANREPRGQQAHFTWYADATYIGTTAIVPYGRS